MRLLSQRSDGSLTITSFLGTTVPPYAILSHRWFDDEPSFQDLVGEVGQTKAGYAKLYFTARRAAQDDLHYFWVDTVCIDKTSSSELQESLNSMFAWYRDSTKCYVYLHDATSISELEGSEWFKRGWTLQELIAPRTVEFYTPNALLLGDKISLASQITSITRIPIEALQGNDLSTFSITERYSWARDRVTTRPEDKAYCLLGIFNVFMPVIYGEKEYASKRLLMELDKLQRITVDLQTLTVSEKKMEANSLEQPPKLEQVSNYFMCKRALYRPELPARQRKIKLFASSQWLFAHDSFRAWNIHDKVEKPADAFLTILGNLGTGKSVLMREAAKRAEESDAGVIVLQHYFDGANAENPGHFKSALDEFCTSLLYQLLDKLEPKPWSFLGEWGDVLRHTPGLLPWDLAQLQNAIQEIIIGHEQRGRAGIRIFIDALDQCTGDMSTPTTDPSEPLELLDWISALLERAAEVGVDVRVCLSRRRLPDYGHREPESHVIIVEDFNRPAIENFLDTKMEKIQDAGLRYNLRRKILERTTNDFLWITVVVRSILAHEKSSSGSDILRLVDEIPSEHKQMYEKLLLTGEFLAQGHTLLLFQMVSGARNPMSADQFRHALTFSNKPDQGSIEQWKLPQKEGPMSEDKFENYLRSESRGLIEVRGDPGLQQTVRFVHSSILTFLRDPRNVLPAEALPWDQRCHFQLLDMSFRALELPGNESVTFVDYASAHWVYHARDCGDLLFNLTSFPRFLDDCTKRKTKRLIEQQIQAVKEQHALQSHLLADKESLLVLLATLGCANLLQLHLAKCKACQQERTLFSEPFQQALRNSIISQWTATTMVLLENSSGAQFDINMLYGNRTLLYKASYFDQKEVVSFLLAHGADPCKRSPTGYEYPLHAAIQCGRVGIVKQLLQDGDHGQFQLRRSAKRAVGYTPLHTAIMSPHDIVTKFEILMVLLDKAPKGVGILAMEDNEGMSVIKMAREQGKESGSWSQELDDEIEDFYDDDN